MLVLLSWPVNGGHPNESSGFLENTLLGILGFLNFFNMITDIRNYFDNYCMGERMEMEGINSPYFSISNWIYGRDVTPISWD